MASVNRRRQAGALAAALSVAAAAVGVALYYSQTVLVSGVPFYQQEKSDWCGPAAMQMLLEFNGVRLNQSEIAQGFLQFQSGGIWGTTTKSMQSFPLLFGFGVHVLNGTVEYVKQEVQKQVPVLVLQYYWNTTFVWHYRVVVGYSDLRGVMIVHDPIMGAGVEIPYSTFLHVWPDGGGQTWAMTINDRRDCFVYAEEFAWSFRRGSVVPLQFYASFANGSLPVVWMVTVQQPDYAVVAWGKASGQVSVYPAPFLFSFAVPSWASTGTFWVNVQVYAVDRVTPLAFENISFEVSG